MGRRPQIHFLHGPDIRNIRPDWLSISVPPKDACCKNAIKILVRVNGWRKNAPDFGFILRFPKNQQHVTGYIFEPWHYRYLGVGLTQEYSASGAKTLEEFFWHRCSTRLSWVGFSQPLWVYQWLTP